MRLKDNPSLPVFTFNAGDKTSKGKKRKQPGKNSIDSTLRKVKRKLDNKHRVLKERRQNMLKLNDSLRNLPSNSPLDRVYDRRESNVSRSFQTDAQTQTEGSTASCGCTLCPGHRRLPSAAGAAAAKCQATGAATATSPSAVGAATATSSPSAVGAAAAVSVAAGTERRVELRDPPSHQDAAEDLLQAAVEALAIKQMDNNNNDAQEDDEDSMQFDDTLVPDCLETTVNEDEMHALCPYSLSDEEEGNSDDGLKKKMFEGKD